MVKQEAFDVAVVGAGAVGASVALWAQADGHRVLLIDRQRPGSGATYGNACTIATYGCIPINSPDIYRRLPRLLFGRDSPLRIDWWYALTHPAWQLAFLRNCSRTRVSEITACLGRLLALADDGMSPLVARCRAESLLADDTGCYYVFDSAGGFDAARRSTEIRRSHGAVVRELSGDDFRALEPGVRMPVFGALAYQGVRFVRDPQSLIQSYVDRLVGDGGRFMQAAVTGVVPEGSSVTLRLEDGGPVRCGTLVVAAGAWSRSLKGSGAEDMPLDTERGYHVLFSGHGGLLRRPVGWAEGGFYAVPMAHGLRLAGTVELAGLAAGPNPQRIDYLARRARQLFGDIGEPDDTWLGFRPTLPDALPVIGPSHRSERIIFAFGHQHVGLTLGGATGKLVADLIASRAPEIDLAPFDPRRFTG